MSSLDFLKVACYTYRMVRGYQPINDGASTDNILRVYSRASKQDIAKGTIWYRDARRVATVIGNGDTAKGAGVIAALSPQQQWETNVKMARHACLTRKASGHFKANNEKANRILRGADPLTVLGGDKVRAFYVNILNGGGDSVTIDRHSLAVAYSRVLDDYARQRIIERKESYPQIVGRYRNRAKILGLSPADLQAITWTTWRREQGGNFPRLTFSSADAIIEIVKSTTEVKTR